MTAEQMLVVDNFKKNFKDFSKIIVYGTGINGEAVIKMCHECDIIGVMDASKEGQNFCGLPVMSCDEVIKSESKCIVIVARPAVHQIIYRRIKKLVKDNGISVFDIYGHIIESKNNEMDNSYFNKNHDELIKEIDCHDVISFDVFDTLVSRCVSEPIDVFELMDINKNEFCIDGNMEFSKFRIDVERKMRHLNPTIEDIYKEIGKKHNFDDEILDKLIKCEINTELKVLRARRYMVNIMKYALEKGKKVILVSDMYLGEEKIRYILDTLEITECHKIYVSCDYKVTKEDGLFYVVKNDYPESNILHIGDNENADYVKPREAGIDAYHIMSSMRMLELSTHRNILSYNNNICTKVMTGMVALKLFDNPFVLYKSKGKVKVCDEEIFTYVYIAPLLVSFVYWLINQIKGKNGIILFASRDGYIIQKLFREFALKYNINDLPEDKYLLISRKAIMEALKEKEISSLNYNNYKNYLDSFKLDDYDEIFMFDFMSKGTCQNALENILERNIKGMYFQKSDGIEQNQKLTDVTAFYKELSALEADRYIFAMCDFFECILSSKEPSLASIDSKGKPVYFEEVRSKEQILLMQRMHQIILKFADEISDIINMSDVYPNNLDLDKIDKELVDFVDELIRCTDVENAIIDVKELNDLKLDINENQIKNTGYDLFVGGRKSGT